MLDHLEALAIRVGDRPARLFLGSGPLALEVVEVRFGGRPQINDLRTLFRGRVVTARRARSDRGAVGNRAGGVGRSVPVPCGARTARNRAGPAEGRILGGVEVGQKVSRSSPSLAKRRGQEERFLGVREGAREHAALLEDSVGPGLPSSLCSSAVTTRKRTDLAGRSDPDASS